MARNDDATYACVNMGEAMVPRELEPRSIRIDGDINEALHSLEAAREGRSL